MNQPIRVGIIGDYDPESRFHTATNAALQHAAKALSLALAFEWLPTQLMEEEPGPRTLEQFDALWCSPGSPYRSMDGALQGIRFAREKGWPFIGT